MARAIISVYDKTGIVDFAKGLAKLGFEIVSTGGTANVLEKARVPIVPIEEITNFPEMLDGRIKTLHPAVHAGILAKRTKKHLNQLKKQGIEPIDLVVVNLYPFEKSFEKMEKHEQLIEKIDIGGPTMLRAAAKNYKDVGIVTSQTQYPEVLKELKKRKKLGLKTKEKLAMDAFNHVARYNTLIDIYFQKKFSKSKLPENLNMSFKKAQELRYGDNPDQVSAFYRKIGSWNDVSSAEQLSGKQISYNNMLDLNSAWELVNEFQKPTAVIIKHNNPCGVASASNLSKAYEQALCSDKTSAFGSVIAFNRTVDTKTAKKMSELFIEAIIARKYAKGVIEFLKKKKNLRIMRVRGKSRNIGLELKSVPGGMLAQTRQIELNKKSFKIVSKRKPTAKELKDMLFAFRVAKYVVSNAIVLAKNQETLGICGGQTSRVDAVKFAAQKANKKSEGAVMASDAFFPFRDGIDEAAKAGVTAVIQPGGSIRDKEVIKAVNEHKMVMVFTGKRVFRH